MSAQSPQSQPGSTAKGLHRTLGVMDLVFLLLAKREGTRDRIVPVIDDLVPGRQPCPSSSSSITLF